MKLKGYLTIASTNWILLINKVIDFYLMYTEREGGGWRRGMKTIERERDKKRKIKQQTGEQIDK